MDKSSTPGSLGVLFLSIPPSSVVVLPPNMQHQYHNRFGVDRAFLIINDRSCQIHRRLDLLGWVYEANVLGDPHVFIGRDESLVSAALTEYVQSRLFFHNYSDSETSAVPQPCAHCGRPTYRIDLDFLQTHLHRQCAEMWWQDMRKDNETWWQNMNKE